MSNSDYQAITELRRSVPAHLRNTAQQITQALAEQSEEGGTWKAEYLGRTLEMLSDEMRALKCSKTDMEPLADAAKALLESKFYKEDIEDRRLVSRAATRVLLAYDAAED